MTDDDEWDDFMSKSDAELDREHATAMREYAEMIGAMSRDEFYAYRRRKRVDLCRRWRAMMREHGLEFPREYLRRSQRALAMLRAERRSGRELTAALQ